MILFGFKKNKTYLSTKALVAFHFPVRNIKIEVILNIISQYTRLLCRQLLRRLYSYATVGRVHTTPNMRRLEDTKTIHWWKKKRQNSLLYVEFDECLCAHSRIIFLHIKQHEWMWMCLFLCQYRFECKCYCTDWEYMCLFALVHMSLYTNHGPLRFPRGTLLKKSHTWALLAWLVEEVAGRLPPPCLE